MSRSQFTNSPQTKWFECFGVVNFDLQQGQKVEAMLPKINLSPEQEAEIAFLCFPDANLVLDGDSSHYFMFGFDTDEEAKKKNNNNNNNNMNNEQQKAPLSEHATELFGVARFRQRRDPSIPRGALQKSVFALSRLPFPSLIESILELVFTKILDDGLDTQEVLRRLVSDVNHQWPRVAPARIYSSLTLFGQSVPPFETPMFDFGDVLGRKQPLKSFSDLSLRDFDPMFQLKSLLTRPTEEILASSNVVAVNTLLLQMKEERKEDDNNNSNNNDNDNDNSNNSNQWFLDWLKQEKITLPNTATTSATSSGSTNMNNAILINQQQVVSLHTAIWASYVEAAEDFPPSAPFVSSGVEKNDTSSSNNNSSNNNNNDDENQTLVDPEKLLGEESSACNFTVSSEIAATLRRVMEALLDEASSVLREVTNSSSPSSTLFSSLSSSSSYSSSPSSVSGKPRELWTDVSLGLCLSQHILKLPKLWELIVAGEDIAVVGPDARTVSSAVLGLRSLIGSVPYCASLRPFLTIHNREVDHEASSEHRGNSNKKSPTNNRSSSLAAASASASSSKSNIPTLVGATNPFFVRHFESWPHFICYGDESDETHKMYDGDSEKREKQQFKLKTRMFSSRHFIVKSEKSVMEGLSRAPHNGNKRDSSTSLMEITSSSSPCSSSSAATSPSSASASAPSGGGDEKTATTTSDSSSSSPSIVAQQQQQEKQQQDLSSPSSSSSPVVEKVISSFPQCHDYAREVVSDLNRNFFGVLDRIVTSILFRPETLFLSDDALQSLFEPQILLERLRNEPASSFTKFKTQKEALLLFGQFLQTPTFCSWLHQRVHAYLRHQLCSTSLEQLLLKCPDLDSKIDMFHLLQWELTKQLEAPVIDVPFVEKLYKLNRQSLVLRDRLWSDI